MRLLVILCACIIGFLGPVESWVSGDAQPSDVKKDALRWPDVLPVYDHIIIVVEENKDYGEIIGNPAAPFINDVLRAEGANFTQMFAEEHFSQGNYFWMFSGSNQTVGFNDQVPSAKNHPDYPFKT